MKMLKNRNVWGLWAWFLFAPFHLWGSSDTEVIMDSLRLRLVQASDDSVRADVLSTLFFYANQSDLAQAEEYLKQTEGLVSENHYPCCYITYLCDYGVFYKLKGEYKRSEKQFLNAIERFKQIGCEQTRITSAYFNLGDVYQNLGDLNKAVSYLTRSQELAFETENQQMIIGALNNLGIVYFKLKQYDEAGDYYKRALETAKKHSTPTRIASLNLNLGNVLLMNHDYEGALEQFQEALKMGEEMGDSARLPNRYINVGIAYYMQERMEEALVSLKKGMLVAQKTGNRHQEASAVRNIGSVFAAKGDYASAIRYTKKALAVFEESETGTELLNGYRNLARYYQKNGDFLMAYETEKDYAELLDSVSQVRRNAQLAEQLATFETARLKAENDSVRSSLKIEQKDGEIKDLQLSRYYVLVIALIGLLLLFGGLVILMIRSRRLKQDLKLMELEHTALRARMNPHFLFNALNSIQNAILNRDKMVAYEYHAKFSELIRMVLMHSAQKTVLLSEELQALRLYLELEQFRTGDKFSYEISTDTAVEPDVQQIPSILLQPFVENAIWHGVLNKEEPGKISIRINIEDGFLRCAIEDDGIGREAALKIRNMRNPGHESVAMKVTASRMELLRQQFGNKVALKITDLFTEGQASGTLVELLIPLQLSV